MAEYYIKYRKYVISGLPFICTEISHIQTHSLVHNRPCAFATTMWNWPRWTRIENNWDWRAPFSVCTQLAEEKDKQPGQCDTIEHSKGNDVFVPTLSINSANVRIFVAKTQWADVKGLACTQ